MRKLRPVHVLLVAVAAALAVPASSVGSASPSSMPT